MSLRRFACALALVLAAFAAWATPHSHDANDLWIVPNESGWGLNLFHQGDTLFGSLFVYGPGGEPRWYTASSLVGGDAGTFGRSVYTGGLYESTGPALGTPFDPARVTRRQVGTMTVELGTESVPQSPTRNFAHITYTVDGVQVVKHAYPFSFVAMGLTGSYTGYVANPNGARDDANLNVTLNGGSLAMSMTTSSNGSCNYSGVQDANGSLFHVAGSFSCGDGRSGTFLLRDTDVTRHGFTAKFSTSGTTWTDLAAQRTSSSIRGDGYSTDLWLAPGESGWGLNIVEQGDTLFGTLFVYDSQGRPVWYSASSLAYEQCAPPDAASDCRGRYRGAVQASTGPYFGTVFNDAAVQRRQAGTMKIDFFGSNTAYIDLEIDGATVMTRKELRRFAFRANSLAGAYAGHVRAFPGQNDRGVLLGPVTIDVSDSAGSLVMTMRSSRTCTLRAAPLQEGRQVVVRGPYECGAGPVGQMSLEDVEVSWSGFTGAVYLDGYTIGRIEGVRTAAR